MTGLPACKYLAGVQDFQARTPALRNRFQRHSVVANEEGHENSRDVIIEFLDRKYPDVGLECPNFPTMVVLFSAAFFRNINATFLQEITGYRRKFIDAIAANMVNSCLWENDEYPGASWLTRGCIDETEFAMQVDVAMGNLQYPRAKSRETIDVLWIDPKP